MSVHIIMVMFFLVLFVSGFGVCMCVFLQNLTIHQRPEKESMIIGFMLASLFDNILLFPLMIQNQINFH